MKTLYLIILSQHSIKSIRQLFIIWSPIKWGYTLNYRPKKVICGEIIYFYYYFAGYFIERYIVVYTGFPLLNIFHMNVMLLYLTKIHFCTIKSYFMVISGSPTFSFIEFYKLIFYNNYYNFIYYVSYAYFNILPINRVLQFIIIILTSINSIVFHFHQYHIS